MIAHFVTAPFQFLFFSYIYADIVFAVLDDAEGNGVAFVDAEVFVRLVQEFSDDMVFRHVHASYPAYFDAFLAFLGGSRLVIHNADFDLGFINAELTRIGRPPLPTTDVVDTVRLARRKFPGAQASLDALCRRFQIDISDREQHGALKDSKLLAAVYLELVGGRQPGLGLAAGADEGKTTTTGAAEVRPPRPHAATPQEEEAHARFLEKLESPLWKI